jgi:hypothetical protein
MFNLEHVTQKSGLKHPVIIFHEHVSQKTLQQRLDMLFIGALGDQHDCLRYEISKKATHFGLDLPNKLPAVPCFKLGQLVTVSLESMLARA